MSDVEGATRAGRDQRALVLAGGGMRVAWQSGVLARLEEEGLEFAHGDGTSGGILSLGMLLSGLSPTEMCGRWQTLRVTDFVSLLPLREYLRSPSDLVAFGDSSGLREKVFVHLGIDEDRIRGTTDMTGTFNVCNFDTKLCEAVPHTEVDVDLMVAGMSLPLFTPAVERNGTTYTDAVWIKDANLLETVRRGFTDLWLVWCIGNTPRWGNGPLEQYVHMIEMSANGALFAEFDVIRDVNERRRAGEAVHGTTEPVRVHAICPTHPLPYDPEFVLGRISADTLVAMGYRDASRYLANADAQGTPLDHHATQMREHDRGVRLQERLTGTAEVGGRPAAALTLDLSVEVTDLDAFADGTSAADVCGRVTFGPWGPPRMVRDGSCRIVTDPSGTIEVRYELGFVTGDADVTLQAVKRIHDDAGDSRWTEVTTASVELAVSRGDGPPEVGHGTVRLTPAAVRRMVASVQALGAVDLPDRIRVVREAGALLLRGLVVSTETEEPRRARMSRQMPPIRTVPWLPLPWIAAMCLPPIGIFIRAGRDSERLRRHELVHWEQYRQRSVLGYYLGYLGAWVRAGFSYQRHPWEIEARRAE